MQKKLIFLSITVLFITVISGCKQKNTPTTIGYPAKSVLEENILDLNGDEIMDTIFIIQQQPREDSSFNSIQISVSGLKKQTLSLEDRCIKLSADHSINPNYVQSQFLYLVKSPKKEYEYILSLFAIGETSRNCYVIKITGGKAKILVNANVLGEVENIEDLDNDGKAEIVTMHPSKIIGYFSDIKAYLYTYTPKMVYKINNGVYSFNLDLSIDYNKKHYIYGGFENVEEPGVLVYVNSNRMEVVKYGRRQGKLWYKY